MRRHTRMFHAQSSQQVSLLRTKYVVLLALDQTTTTVYVYEQVNELDSIIIHSKHCLFGVNQ